MNGQADLKFVTKLGAERLAIVHSFEPTGMLVIHRRKCKQLKTGECTCQPTFIQPVARV